MNGRERILRILNRQPVDRPAFDLGGTDCSGIHVLAYARLRQHLGLPEKPVRCGCLSQLVAVPDADFLDALRRGCGSTLVRFAGDEGVGNSVRHQAGGAEAVRRGGLARRFFRRAKPTGGDLRAARGGRLLLRSGRAAFGTRGVGQRPGAIPRSFPALRLLLCLRRARRRACPTCAAAICIDRPSGGRLVENALFAGRPDPARVRAVLPRFDERSRFGPCLARPLAPGLPRGGSTRF